MTAVTAVSASGTSRALLAFADTATFSTIVAAVLAVPITFSIADADVFALPKTILTIGLACAVGILMTLRWIAGGGSVVAGGLDPLTMALGAFVGWNLLAASFAVDPSHALPGEPLQYQGLLGFLAYAVLFVASWTTVRDARRRRIVLAAVVLAAAVVSCYAILQRLGLDPIWSRLHEGRVFSTIGQPNALGAYLVLALPLVVALTPGRSLRAQAMLSAVALMLLAAIGLTLSRGALLGTAVSAVVLGAALFPRWRQVVGPRLIGIATVAALAVGLCIVAVPAARAAATAVAGRVIDPGRVEQASASAHVDQWAVGVEIALERPLFGAGQDSYVLVFHEYRDDVLPAERAAVWARYRPESPHNVYLAIAGGAGIVALMAYLSVVGIVVRRLIRVVVSAKLGTAIVASAVVAAVTGNLVTDFFMTAETTESALMWILLGIGAALSPATVRSP